MNSKSTWEKIKNHHIIKEFKFDDFKQALNFVNKIGEIAEKSEHHPDISISYNIVKIKIYTHKVDGLTEKDFDLAEKIDNIKWSTHLKTTNISYFYPKGESSDIN